MAQNNALDTIRQQDAELAALAATTGDLNKLTESQRTALYGAICRSVGLNPVTQPFAYMKNKDGKLFLYALKGAADQLRKINGVSIVSVEKESMGDVLMVTVTVKDAAGRLDTDIGAVPTKGLFGEALANAHMKAITKAKRRVTLSISGLGFLDESEVATIPNVEYAVVDRTTGELTEVPAITSGMDRQRDWNTANAALHAWADEIGITHDDLHNAAVALSKGTHTSLADMTADQLDGLKSRLQDASNRDPVKFAQWLDSIDPKAPQAPTTPAQPNEPLTPEEAIELSLGGSGQLPGLDDAELERNIDRVAEMARA